MLALDFVEGLGCGSITLFDHLIHGFVVEIVDRFFDINVLFPAAAGCENGYQSGYTEPPKCGQWTHRQPQ